MIVSLSNRTLKKLYFVTCLLGAFIAVGIGLYIIETAATQSFATIPYVIAEAFTLWFTVAFFRAAVLNTALIKRGTTTALPILSHQLILFIWPLSCVALTAFIPLQETPIAIALKLWLVVVALAYLNSMPANVEIQVGHKNIIIVLCSIMIIILPFVIGKVPRPISVDEPAEANFSYYLTNQPSQKLDIKWPFYTYFMSQTEFVLNAYPASIVSGQFMKVFGFTIESFRLFHLLIASCSLIPIFAIVNLLHSRHAAWVAITLALPILYTVTFGRAISFGLLCISLVMYATLQVIHRNLRIWQYLVGGVTIGLVSGLAYEGHPYTIVFAITYGLCLSGRFVYDIFTYQQQQKTYLKIFAPILGLMIGIVFFSIWFYIVHVAPALHEGENVIAVLAQTYAKQQQFSLAETPSFWKRVIDNSGFQMLYYVNTNPVMAVVGILCAVATLIKGTRLQKVFVGIWSLSAVLFSLILTHANVHYTVLNVLFVATLAGTTVAGSRSPRTLTLFIWLLLSANIVSVAVQPFINNDVLLTAQRMSRLIPPNVEIVAPEAFFWGMLDHASNYHNTLYLGFLKVDQPIQPDVFIFTSKGHLGRDRFTADYMAAVREWGMVKVYCIPSVLDEEVNIYFKPELVQYAKSEYRCK